MTEIRDLLFELGTEELPPTSLLKLQNALHTSVEAALDKAGLVHGTIKAYATPRRLALLIENLVTAQADKTVNRRGPAVQAALQPDGTPTQAALGFAKSCGTHFDQLSRIKTDKGEWLSFEQTIQGASTEALIADMITHSLATLPIAKRMRWGDSSAEFVRPVHQVVLLFGEQVIDAEILGIQTGRDSFGHRFHHPQLIPLTSPADYARQLLETGQVIADFEQRKQTIEQAVRDAATSMGGIAHIEPALLEENTGLVEWPVAVLGRFDSRYLNLPSEVLITSMQSHQKYFPVKNKQGDLLPCFIALSNIDSHNPDAVRKGNERVILPRLSDAEFFWQQDQKHSLADRVEALESIVFQKQLGSVADKSRRVEALAGNIAGQLDADVSLAMRAAKLAKTDLLTDMVGEFPSLQGLMGRYYAQANGEPEAVAIALEEQYQPKQSGAVLPETETGTILSLAEKIDTLSGIFSAGMIPSGDKDPYALRRAALGLLRIIVEKTLDLDLTELVGFALTQYSHKFDLAATHTQILSFIADRQKGYCLDRGYTIGEFDSVFAVKPASPMDFELRLHAVKEFSRLAEAESLAAANKRIRNILRKSDSADRGASVDLEYLLETAEKQLFTTTCSAIEAVKPLMNQRDYTPALCRLAELRDPVDHFFDEVMVMTDDPAVKRNRLALLAMIETLFLQIADISRL